ncbi:MAG TPA: TolC family protein [Candidatus Bathyarchaeia archaeon]|nr:TolC family protein [Candidatus Bathyarchaeia archaeon]
MTGAVLLVPRTDPCRARRARWRGAALVLASLLPLAAPARAADPIVTLEEASARALATDEQIQAAAADRERAAVAPLRAASALGPNVREIVSYTREKDEIAFPPEAAAALPGFNPVVIAQDVVRNVLAIGQPLYTHQFWALRDIGRAEVARSDEAYRAARQDVLLAVAAAYYDALRAAALADVARQTQGLAGVEVKHAEERVHAGEAVRSDVLRAETERARSDERVAATAGQVENTRESLRRLASLSEPFALTEPPSRRLDLASVEPYLAAARDRSPDLAQREKALASAQGEEKRRQAELYPTLGLEFSYQNLNHDTFADRNDFWNLIVRAQVPLFESGGTHWLDVAEQRAVVSRLAAQLAGFRRDLEVDVRHAFVTARTLDAQRAAAEEEVQLSGETYRMLSDQYRAGVATNLDVLTSLTTLATARASLASIRYALAVALVQLERVAGTLGEAEGATP